jgi:hypothetical protein
MLVWCFTAFGACHCKAVDLLGDACLVVGGASRLQHDLHFPPETSFAVDMLVSAFTLSVLMALLGCSSCLSGVGLVCCWGLG